MLLPIGGRDQGSDGKETANLCKGYTSLICSGEPDKRMEGQRQLLRIDAGFEDSRVGPVAASKMLGIAEEHVLPSVSQKDECLLIN